MPILKNKPKNSKNKNYGIVAASFFFIGILGLLYHQIQ
jgi:hypothetical protein